MTFLISFIPFLFMIYYFRIVTRKSNDYKLEVLWGERCWNCLTKFDREDIPLVKQLNICKSCDRHIKISSIRSKFFENKIKIKRLFVSEKFRNITTRLIFLNLFFLSIYIMITFTFPQYNLFFSILTTFFNCLFWILLILQNKFTSIKKPSDI